MEKEKYIHIHEIINNDSYLEQVAKTDEEKIKSFLASNS